MTFLRGTKLCEAAVTVRALRSQGIAVTGPFRMRNGASVCSISVQSLVGGGSPETASPIESNGDGSADSLAEHAEDLQ